MWPPDSFTLSTYILAQGGRGGGGKPHLWGGWGGSPGGALVFEIFNPIGCPFQHPQTPQTARLDLIDPSLC